MTELSKRTPRCYQCGVMLADHGSECIAIDRNSFDCSHEHLLEIDRLAGLLLAEILRFRSLESVANSTFAAEFVALLDERRKG
jgi:ribosomal protein S27AE